MQDSNLIAHLNLEENIPKAENLKFLKNAFKR